MKKLEEIIDNLKDKKNSICKAVGDNVQEFYITAIGHITTRAQKIAEDIADIAVGVKNRMEKVELTEPYILKLNERIKTELEQLGAAAIKQGYCNYDGKINREGDARVTDRFDARGYNTIFENLSNIAYHSKPKIYSLPREIRSTFAALICAYQLNKAVSEAPE